MMMNEVVELQHQQHKATQQIEVVKEKLEGAERRQKQMVSFLARMFWNPALLARLQQRKSITSPRQMRKFVKHEPREPVSNRDALKQLLDHPWQDTGDSPLFGVEYVPSQFEDITQDDFPMAHELLHTPDEAKSVPTLGTAEPSLQGENVMSPQPQPTNESFVSFPGDLVMEKSIPELAGTESTARGDVWGMSFEADNGIYNSPTESWGSLGSHNPLDLGVSNGLSNIWDIGALPVADSPGIERWLDEDSSLS
ncbi:hypothetical protein CDL12_17159 [Handroanthus impetiginosus]|uniref:Uncharacterized protein n=1 Tax=Handroanthus impetiginosus TaxID=429701 RepID=A0A2G9GY99_9LAMI|nr:hypothetical protein CDL12_17159 [Handroanthus impetiginosus]